MMTSPSFVLLALAGLALSELPSLAQGIRAVTRRVLVSPAPGVFLPAQAPQPNAPANPPQPPVVATVYQFAFKPPTQAEKDQLERRVIEYQEQRAAKGSGQAAFDLALRYWKGNGVEADRDKARQWLKAAADNGHSRALEKLKELETEARDEEA